MNKIPYFRADDFLFVDGEDHRNDFLLCLKAIVSYFNLTVRYDEIQNIESINIENFHHYEHQFSVMLCSVSFASMKELSHSLLPLLVKNKKDNKWYVYINKWLGKKKLYNPYGTKKYAIFLNHCDVNDFIFFQCYPDSTKIDYRYFNLMCFIFKFIRKDLLYLFVSGAVVAAFTVPISMMSGYILNHAYQNGHASYIILFISFLLCLSSMGIMTFLNDVYIKWLNAKIISFILPSLWGRFLQVPLNKTRHYTSGDWAQRLFDYESSVSSVLTASFFIIFDFSSLLFLWIYMAYCHFILAFLYSLIGVLFIVIKIIYYMKQITYVSQKTEGRGSLFSFLNETLLQISKIRSANAETVVFSKWFAKAMMVKAWAEKCVKLEILCGAMDSLALWLLSLFFYAMVFLTSKPSVAVLLQLMICSTQFSRLYEKLSFDIMGLIQHFPGMKRIQPILKEVPQLECRCNDTIPFIGELKLSDVTLRHQKSNRLLLDNISMEVSAGQFVGIIGASGSGKSTLFKILLGLEVPSSGVMTLGCENIQNINVKSMRKQIGVVMQNANIFSGTIFFNMTLNTYLTLDEAWQLARWVGLEADIQKMPMKMYTYISDNAGESISGGQKQKILIARALAMRPKMLLLDEATSAMDANSQAIIYENLRILKITRVVIAHRYSSIEGADVIYILEKGKIKKKSIFPHRGLYL